MVVLYASALLGGLAWVSWAVSTVGFAQRMRVDSVIAAALPGGVLVLLVRYALRRSPLRWAHVMALVGWGIFIVGSYGLAVALSGGPLLIGLAHIDPLRASDAEIAVLGPLVEEAAKALGVLWGFTFLPRRPWPVAGLLYVSLVGIGFATLENVTHFNASGVSWGMSWARLPGYFSHPMYTACFAALLGMVWADPRRWLRALLGVLGWLLGAGLHMMSNMSNVRAPDLIHARVFAPLAWMVTLLAVRRFDEGPSEGSR